MVKLSRNTDSLIVTIKGVNKLMALKNRIVIPFDSIDEVAVNLNDDIAIWQGIRLPSTSVPGFIHMGTRLTLHGRHFYLRKKGHESIILDLQDHKYKRIVVDVEDPVDAVSQILTWLDDYHGIDKSTIRITR